jgi:hypothetical protein
MTQLVMLQTKSDMLRPADPGIANAKTPDVLKTKPLATGDPPFGNLHPWSTNCEAIP